MTARKSALQPARPLHFTDARALADWFDKNHEHAALRVGWIDGIRKPLSDEAYVIRFTPRREGSVWSAINIHTAQELITQGRMHANGLRAFEGRHAHPHSGYRIAERTEQLPAALEKPLRAQRKAWAWWQAQSAAYRRAAVHWITSARRDDTRARRLAELIADCAAGRRIGALTPPVRKG